MCSSTWQCACAVRCSEPIVYGELVARGAHHWLRRIASRVINFPIKIKPCIAILWWRLNHYDVIVAYLKIQLKLRVVMVPSLSSLVAPQVVVMSDDKISITTITSMMISQACTKMGKDMDISGLNDNFHGIIMNGILFLMTCQYCFRCLGQCVYLWIVTGTSPSVDLFLISRSLPP